MEKQHKVRLNSKLFGKEYFVCFLRLRSVISLQKTAPPIALYHAGKSFLPLIVPLINLIRKSENYLKLLELGRLQSHNQCNRWLAF